MARIRTGRFLSRSRCVRHQSLVSHGVDEIVDSVPIGQGSHWLGIFGGISVFPRVSHVGVEVYRDHHTVAVVIHGPPGGSCSFGLVNGNGASRPAPEVAGTGNKGAVL